MKDLKIFICAHQPIKNKLPKGDNYIIMAQNDTIKDNNHQVIYLTDDEFTKSHWRCYGEGCAMKYLWKHPELLPNYIGIAHYRRFFLDFVGKEQQILSTLKQYKAIVAYPFIFDGKRLKTNIDAQTKDHFEEDSLELRNVIKDLYPEFSKEYEKSLFETYFFPCNMFIIKKEDFLEMCEVCFTILDEFDKRMNYINNESVYKKILFYQRYQRIPGSIGWQARLQGFYLEWLTNAYFKYKFGLDNCYISSIGTLEGKVCLYGRFINSYEKCFNNRQWINRCCSSL